MKRFLPLLFAILMLLTGCSGSKTDEAIAVADPASASDAALHEEAIVLVTAEPTIEPTPTPTPTPTPEPTATPE